MNCADLTTKLGHVVAFIGNESSTWGDQDYVHAAQNAHALGINTLAFKAFDGLRRWYVSPSALRVRCEHIRAAGCGAIPWGYCYGAGYGNAQVDGECILLQELLIESGGFALADMEAEWNNHAASANYFTQVMRGRKRGADMLGCTTWADPIQQNWTQVITGLGPVIDFWVPQEYTNWLATQEQQLIDLHAHCIQPAIDVLGDFGAANNPSYAAGLAKEHGDTTIWLWEYGGIRSASALVKDFAAGQVKPKYPPSAAVQLPSPIPAPAQHGSYTIQAGETLAGIAGTLGLSNWFQQLYLPNRAALDGAAKAHGLANSQQGALIWPGQVLNYAH